MPKRAHSESDTTVEAGAAQPALKRPKPDDTSDTNSTAPPILLHTAFSKWNSSSLSQTHPPLPQVLDPALETAALTHSGMRKSLADLSYERLEWIGDAYLELIASELIYATFGSLEPGKCSQYREMLVRNSTLGQFSVHYGLDKRANFPSEFGLGGRPNGTTASQKQRTKALGDIFEAYVGALVKSDPEHGIRRATEWLKALWGPVLEQHIRDEERGAHVISDVNPKTQLDRLIGGPGIKIEYRDLPSNGKRDKDTKQPLFVVGCFLHGWGETGLQLGYGSALGKKEAGQNAALKAMGNKKLIKKFADKKKAFQDARTAQAARAARAEKVEKESQAAVGVEEQS